MKYLCFHLKFSEKDHPHFWLIFRIVENLTIHLKFNLKVLSRELSGLDYGF